MNHVQHGYRRIGSSRSPSGSLESGGGASREGADLTPLLNRKFAGAGIERARRPKSTAMRELLEIAVVVSIRWN
jgi:hypothetical protein